MHIFSGLYKNKKIISPKGLETRPTSGRLREALFNICQSEVSGSSFLDLFSGSGAMGLEALSRGAKQVTFVDNNKESIQSIQVNIKSFGIEKESLVIEGDVFSIIKKLAKQQKKFDIIYVDPPYESFLNVDGKKISYSTQVILHLEELIEVKNSILTKEGILFIEDSLKALSLDKDSYKHLILSKSRSMGRSVLQQWINK